MSDAAMLVPASVRIARFGAVLASVVRVGVAAALLSLCWQDVPTIQARAEFEALPDFDYWKQAAQLLDQERFSEALLVVDAGEEAVPAQKAQLEELRKRIEVERGQWMYKFQQFGQGALRGTGQSAEALGGAVVADLFVFGDVRDLVIQAGRKLRGEETDEVLVLLSAGGILLTVSPELDLGSALLKFARRMGVMTDEFAKGLTKTLKRALQSGSADEVAQVTNDVVALEKKARPAGTMTILRTIEDPGELRLAAQFAQKPGGTFALWFGGRQSITWLKSGAEDAEGWLLKASRRGRAGMDFLAQRAGLMFAAHPLLGLVKGLWKGNIPALLQQLFRAYSHVLIGLAGGWLAYEGLLLLARIASLG